VKTYDVQPDVILSREDVGTLVISSIKSSVTYDTRDNPFDPSRGLLAGISVKAASPLLLSETYFNKFEAYGSFFHKLHKRVVLAVSVREAWHLDLEKLMNFRSLKGFSRRWHYRKGL